MSTMQVDVGRLGEWTTPSRFAIDAHHIIAYAAAINDAHPLYAGGMMAPPVFSCVPVIEHIGPAIDKLVDAEHRRWGVHGAQDLYLFQPMRPGMVLFTRGAPTGVFTRRGVASIVIKTQSRLEDGTLINVGYTTLLIRRRLEGIGGGEPAPDHRTPPEARSAAQASGAVLTVSELVDHDQTYRYADASGDRNPIHLDPAFARSVGLPGIIVHGMCTMGFVGRAAVSQVCGDDPARLHRLAVRFVRPVLPGQVIVTSIWPAGTRDGRAAYALETVNPDGKAVIQDGLVEVRA